MTSGCPVSDSFLHYDLVPAFNLLLLVISYVLKHSDFGGTNTHTDLDHYHHSFSMNACFTANCNCKI